MITGFKKSWEVGLHTSSSHTSVNTLSKHWIQVILLTGEWSFTVELLNRNLAELNKLHKLFQTTNRLQTLTKCVCVLVSFSISLQSICVWVYMHQTMMSFHYCVLTEPFSMTLLSMMTALVFCSQIMSQKWPQVFLRGPCRKQTHTQTHFDQLDGSGTVESNLQWKFRQKITLPPIFGLFEAFSSHIFDCAIKCFTKDWHIFI